MANWHDLAAELKVITLNYLIDDITRARRLHLLSAYAAVSREWQWFFERKNFRRLRLHQSDLPEFQRIFNTTRISLLFAILFEIELPEYTCASCNSEETDEEASKNNSIVTSALWNLFTILSAWNLKYKVQGGLSLYLGIYSSSDRKHHFRDYRSFRYSCQSPRIKYNDPAHGWYSNTQVAPALGPKLSLLGKPLDFDFHQIHGITGPPSSLPELAFVSALFMPRRYFRAIPNLPLILRALPNLNRLTYEIWRPVTKEGKDISITNFLKIMNALPSTLTILSIFETSNEALHFKQDQRSCLICPTPSIWKSITGLTQFNASFLIDANSFLMPFYLGSGRAIKWENLQNLILTSSQLIRYKKLQEIEELLCAVAKAALRMPRLKALQLWYTHRCKACIFRYKNIQGMTSIEWCDTEQRHIIPIFNNKIIQAWRAVTETYGKGCLSIRTGRIQEHIRSPGSVLPYLEGCQFMMAPGSLNNIIWEANHLMPVRRRPPPGGG